MSGTNLVILAMYSTVDVVTTRGPTMQQILPYVLALLMVAASLTCAGTLAMCRSADRSKAKGAKLAQVQRRITGPRDRRR